MPRKNKIKIVLEVDDKGTATIKSFGKETDKAFEQMKNKAQASTTSMNSSLKSLNLSFAAVTAAMTGAAYAMTRLVSDVAKTGDQFHKMSLRVGESSETLSALGYAAQISGTNIATLEKALRYASNVMLDVSQGVGEAKRTFDAMGLSVTNTQGKLKGTADFLLEVADRFKKMTDETKMAAYASEIFGARAGTQLLPLLKLGSQGIQDLMDKAHELGIVFDTESAAKAAEFTDSMTDLTSAFEGLKREIGTGLLPVLTEYAEKLTEIIADNRDFTDTIGKATDFLIKYAGALAQTGSSSAAFNLMFIDWLTKIEETDYGSYAETFEKEWKAALAALKGLNAEIEITIKHTETDISLTALNAEYKKQYYKDQIALKKEWHEFEEKHRKERIRAIAADLAKEAELEESFWGNYEKQTMTAVGYDLMMLDRKYAAWEETYGHLEEFQEAYWKEYGKILDSHANKTEETLDATTILWQHALENIQDISVEVMFDLFHATEDGFENLLDTMLDHFLKFLSNLVSEALMTDIFSPLMKDFQTYGVQSLFGLGGAGIAGPAALGMAGGAVVMSTVTSEDPSSALQDLADTVYDMTIFGFVEAVDDAIEGAGHRTRLGGTYGISFTGGDFAVSLLEPYVDNVTEELAAQTNEAIIDTIELTMQGYEDLFDELNDKYQLMIADMLEGFEVEGMVKGHAEHLESRIETMLEDIPEQIGDILDPIFQSAITAYAVDMAQALVAPGGPASNILSNLIPESVIFDAIDIVRDMLSSADQLTFEELYLVVDTIEDINDTLETIGDMWKGINFEIGVMLGEVSELDQVIFGINQQFDAYIAALGEYATPEIIAQIESFRPEVIAHATQEMSDALWEEIMMGIWDMLDIFTPLEQQIFDVERQFDQWMDRLLSETYATPEQIQWLEDARIYTINELTRAENELIASEEERVRVEKELARIQDQMAERERMQAAFAPMGGIMEDIAWRQSGMSRQAWIEQQLNALGGLYTQGLFGEEEAQQAMQYISEWYNIAMAEQQDTAKAWEDAADRAKSLAQSVESTMQAIKYGPLNVAVPAAKYGMAVPDYTALYLAAMSGDETAIQEFLDFAPQYLALAQDTYKSSLEYQNIYEQVMKDMSAVKDLIESDDFTERLYYESLDQGETLLSIDQHIVDMINTWNLGMSEVIASAGLMQEPTGGSLGAEISARYGGIEFSDAHAREVMGWLAAATPESLAADVAWWQNVMGITVTAEQLLADAEAIVGYYNFIQDAMAHGDYRDWSSFQHGGIASGPESGYIATLHGTELVISPRGTYPATIVGGDRAQELAELREQNALLRQLVAQSETPVEVSIDGKALEPRMYKVVDSAESGRRMVQ